MSIKAGARSLSAIMVWHVRCVKFNCVDVVPVVTVVAVVAAVSVAAVVVIVVAQFL